MVGRKNGAASGFVTAAIGLFRSRMVSKWSRPIHCDFGSSAMVAMPGATGAGVGAFAAAVCAIGASVKTSSLCFALSPSVSFAASTGFKAEPSVMVSASADSAWSVGRRTSTVGSSEEALPESSSESSPLTLPSETTSSVLRFPSSAVERSALFPAGAYMALLAQRYTPRLPSCVVASMSIAGESAMPVTTFLSAAALKRSVCSRRAAGTSQTRTAPSAEAANTQRPSEENSRLENDFVIP